MIFFVWWGDAQNWFFSFKKFFWMTWTENWILWSVLTWFLNFIEILWWIYGLKRLLCLRWVFDLGRFVWKRPIFDDGLNVENFMFEFEPLWTLEKLLHQLKGTSIYCYRWFRGEIFDGTSLSEKKPYKCLTRR